MEMKDILKQIRPLMKAKGFRHRGKLFYCIQDNIACCLELEQPSHLIYLEFYILPLYIPFENRCFTYGNRISLNHEISNMQSSKKSGNTEIFYDLFCRILDTTVFPFYQKVSSPKKLTQIYEQHTKNAIFFCTPVERKRLYYLTYAYLRDEERLMELAEQYRFALNAATYYAEPVKAKYYLEIEFINHLSKSGKNAIESYYTQIIQETSKKCLGSSTVAQ